MGIAHEVCVVDSGTLQVLDAVPLKGRVLHPTSEHGLSFTLLAINQDNKSNRQYQPKTQT